MSEFKYACPVCGQHMMCDSSHGGSTMECPTCFQKIIAPQAPASEGQKLILTGTKAGERPVPAGTMNPEPPASTAPAKIFPAVAVVLVILVCIAGAAAFMFRDKIFKSKPAAAAAEAVDDAGDLSPPSPGSFSSGTPANGAGSLALKKPSFASSQENQNPVQNGNDGDPRTRWCAASGSVPQWWEVDLGKTETITNAQVAWEHEGVYQYEIQTSLNNKDWTTVINKTKNFIPAPVNSDNFSARGRYVRIIVTGLQSGSWASFYEFQALGFGG